ncbi:MAG: hypothetical protein WD690_03715, partial [Vicinamibacterales bacterium]
MITSFGALVTPRGWRRHAVAVAIAAAESISRKMTPAFFMVCGQYSEGGCTLQDVRALGIDFGARRIGLALSDATGML